MKTTHPRHMAMIVASLAASSVMPSNYTVSNDQLNRYRSGSSAFIKRGYMTAEKKKRLRKLRQASQRRNRA